MRKSESRGVYYFHSRVFCHIWDGSCKTHFWTPRKWSRLRLDHFLGVQKCVLQLPSHTLILTLDTDLEKDTPIIPVFFCLWIQFPPHKMCSTKTITNIKYHFFYSFITSLGLTDDSVHYFSSSPFKTCFHSKTKTALHQWLQNSISLMNFLLITSCSHCRINIWNIPATMSVSYTHLTLPTN